MLKSLNTRAYVDDYLRRKTRPDKRGFDSFRDIRVTKDQIKSCASSSLIKIGKTIVVCGISLELARPEPTLPEYGCVICNVDVSPMCSASIRPGPPSDFAQAVSTMVQEIFTDERVLSVEELVIIPGKLAWAIYVDIYCINDDGNIEDAAIIAASSALKDTKLPELVIEDTFDNLETDTKCIQMIPSGMELSASHLEPNQTIINARQNLLKATPISTQFSVMERGEVLIDPSRDELETCKTNVHICTLIDKQELLFIKKYGCSDFDDITLEKCIELAKSRARKALS